MQSLSPVDKQFIDQLTTVIEENLAKEDFGVDELAQQLGMSRSTLHRKVKGLIKKSVSEFIREMRLKRAHELLEKNTGTVSEIAYNVGFSSVPYFNRCFNKEFGYTPGEVLKGLHPTIQKDDRQANNKPKFKLSNTHWLTIVVVLLISATFTFFWLHKHESLSTHKNIAILPVHVDKNSEEIEEKIQWISREVIH